MLPEISPELTVDPLYQAYLDRLRKSEFSGEIRVDYASRMAVATDNSIYQVIPQAVILPKNIADIVVALQLGAEKPFQQVKFSPRGGGTATNGQSLSCSIIIDCSKYMRDILELNIQECWVRVQPGVVQDQLNQYLLPYGLHFAPEISPSNRATLGGMINTDACGNGQKILGRTSDHVIELTGVMSDGTMISSCSSKLPIFDEVSALLAQNQVAIRERFPVSPRTLSGYNLLKAYSSQLNLNYLLCGSEGTLVVIGECKLKLTPIPKYKKCVVLHYHCFDDALCAFDLKHGSMPLVVECIDERLLELARKDSIYNYVKDYIDQGDKLTGAINLVEFVSDDEACLSDQINTLCNYVNIHKNKPQNAMGYAVVHDHADIKKLWELRKKSVGLISKSRVGTRRPIPFIEDTAVPPDQLVSYIQEVKNLLDEHKLTYGMYGHIDAGCVHVRPALDMQCPDDRKIHEILSTKIVAMVKKYNGVMWGEHGMGFRVQFNELFFGTELYAVVRKVKTLFDPYNKLNPGKVALPLDSDEALMPLSGPLRGQFDSQIPVDLQSRYSTALACNGNGACFNYATQEIMCPSYKVTKDRIHSPKGRAVLLREWLRLSNRLYFNGKLHQPKNKNDFSHEVYAALNGCLGCKACANQCPLNVDIPALKAKFLESYFQRYSRPVRDYLIAFIESIICCLAAFPRVSNTLMNLKISRWILKKGFGLVDVPEVSKVSLRAELLKRKAPILNFNSLSNLTAEEKLKSVIVLQDVLSSFYNPNVVLKTYDLFHHLGYTVYVAPFRLNGKSYYDKGFLKKFSAIARRNIGYLNKLASLGVSIVGIDPSLTLTYRDEYQKVSTVGKCRYNVLLPQEWLQDKLPHILKKESKVTYHLLAHCSEKTMCGATEKQWVKIFSAFGQRLNTISVGCCGMSGVYGYEVEHIGLSRQLFSMDWQLALEQRDENNVIIATGFSCQSQAKRFQGVNIQHPLEVLSKVVLSI